MSIAVFGEINNAVAIVRTSGGILKQTKVFARLDRVFIPMSGGYMMVRDKFGGEFLTANPNVKVLEIEGDGITQRGSDAPMYKAR